MEMTVSKSTYLFEILDETGAPLKRLARRCNNIRAYKEARGLLDATPGACVVFGFERDGNSVLSAYRE